MDVGALEGGTIEANVEEIEAEMEVRERSCNCAKDG